MKINFDCSFLLNIYVKTIEINVFLIVFTNLMIVSKSVHGYTPVHKNRKDTNLVKINKQVCIILKPKYHISLYKNVLNRYQHNNISYESIHFLYSVRFPGGESKNRYI